MSGHAWRWTIAIVLASAACARHRQPVEEVRATGGEVELATAEAVTGRIASSIASDAHVLGILGEIDAGEIAAARLSQHQALSQAVREYASRMILEHTRLDRQIRDLSAYAGIPVTLPDSTLPRLHGEMLAELARTSGARFDRAYLTQQLRAHERALALVNAGFRLADNDQLRTMLATIVRPSIQEHLERADELARAVGASR